MSTGTPTAAERFQGVEIKISRSAEHLNHLDREIAYFLYLKPYEFLSQLSSDGRELSAVCRLTMDPRPDWSGVIGDILHNLRSALEHLAFQIVDANGGSPGSDTKFPIYPDKAAYTGWRTPSRRRRDPFAAVDQRAIQAIEDEQPYQRRDDDDPKAHPLYELNQLWNRDKHRILIPALIYANQPPAPTGMIFTLPSFTFVTRDFEREDTEQPPFISNIMMQTGRLENGETMVRETGRVAGPNPEIDMEGDLLLNVCLDDGRLLMGVLGWFHNYVFELAQRLRAFL